MKSSVLLGVLLSISTLLFAQQQPVRVDEIVGVVGDEIILHSDVVSAMIEGGEVKAIPDPRELCDAYENLLYQKLLLHHAKLDSVEVSDAEVQNQVERRLSYFVEMLGSVEQFEQYYGKTVSQMKDEYFDVIKEQLLVQKQQSEITKNVKVTPGDVMNFYNGLPADSLPLIGEQVQYSMIQLAPQIRESERGKVMHFLDSIRQDIVDGRTSMTLQAARWSEDPGSRYKGGCYPMQARGAFVPPYEAAVFNTPEGGYSPVFESDFGYHFVKVVEKRGEYYESCHILMTPKVTTEDLDQAKQRADSVYKALSTGGLSFKSAAVRFSTDKDTKNQEGRVASMRGGFRHDVSQLSAELNLVLQGLKTGGISEPVLMTSPDGKQAYVIYLLNDRMPAHKANMKDDYEIFQAQTDAELRQKELDIWVKKKLAWTFTSVGEEYSHCDFQFAWIKPKE